MKNDFEFILDETNTRCCILYIVVVRLLYNSMILEPIMAEILRASIIFYVKFAVDWCSFELDLVHIVDIFDLRKFMSIILAKSNLGAKVSAPNLTSAPNDGGFIMLIN